MIKAYTPIKGDGSEGLKLGYKIRYATPIRTINGIGIEAEWGEPNSARIKFMCACETKQMRGGISGLKLQSSKIRRLRFDNGADKLFLRKKSAVMVRRIRAQHGAPSIWRGETPFPILVAI